MIWRKKKGYIYEGGMTIILIAASIAIIMVQFVGGLNGLLNSNNQASAINWFLNNGYVAYADTAGTLHVNGDVVPVTPGAGSVGTAASPWGSGVFNSLTDAGLSSQQVVYAGTGGLLSGNSNFTFDSATTTVRVPTANVTAALFSKEFVGTMLVPVGSLVVSEVAGGTLSAETYNFKVFPVNVAGAEGLKSGDGSIVIGANKNILVSWNATAGASSYHVLTWTSAQGTSLNGRYYSTTGTSITISVDPTSPPTGLAAVAGAAGSLKAGEYSFWVTAMFADGQTNYSGNSTAVRATVLSANNGAGSVALTWNAVVGATSYRVYIGTENTGGRRPAIYYLDVGNVLGWTYTGQTLNFAYPFGNTDLAADGMLIAGSIRTVGNAKSIFGADILINGDTGSEAVIQTNRSDANTSLSGSSYRTGDTEKWAVGLMDASNDFIVSLSSPPAGQAAKSAYWQYSTGDLNIYRYNTGTNDDAYPLRFRRESSGVVADGFGTGQAYILQAADGSFNGAGYITGNWYNATTKVSELHFGARSAGGTQPTILTLRGDGTANVSGTLYVTNGIDNNSIAQTNVSGTWTKTGTWTLPAHNLGGTLNANGNGLSNVASLTGGLSNDYFLLRGLRSNATPGQAYGFQTQNAAGAYKTVLAITGGTNADDVTWSNVGTMTIGSSATVIPDSDNTTSIGSASKRFALVRAVTITPGDLVFENDWRITEAEKLGMGTGLVLMKPDGTIVQVWK